jgi:hypothetical protein
MSRFDLRSARDAARRGDLPSWVGEFLASRGSDNATLAAGLAQRPHRWFGPIELPLDELVRLAGPESEAVCTIEPEEWEDDVESMEAEVSDGWQPPPLLAELRGDQLLVQDGNHRYEALQRAGESTAWVIVWADDADDGDRFAARYASAINAATSASDPTRS